MAALSKERMTRVLKAGGMDFPVAASKKIYQGAFVCLDGGYLVPATEDTGLTPVGRASDTVDNSSGAAGAATCHVDFMRERTFFPFGALSDEQFAQTDVGGPAFFVDDQTVSPDDGSEPAVGETPAVPPSRSLAGTVFRVEGTGATQVVWVEV